MPEVLCKFGLILRSDSCFHVEYTCLVLLMSFKCPLSLVASRECCIDGSRGATCSLRNATKSLELGALLPGQGHCDIVIHLSIQALSVTVLDFHGSLLIFPVPLREAKSVSSYCPRTVFSIS